MKIATWNIYWLGSPTREPRTADDERVIRQVIQHVAPDVIALQEIVDPILMERLLADVDAGTYTLRPNGSWLTSESNPTNTSQDRQKVFLSINQDSIEFVRGAVIKGGPSGRKPYAARLRHRSSNREFVVVSAHLRSGFPDFLGIDDAETRTKEARAIVRWLRGDAAAVNPGFPEPGLEDVVVLGDFNAQLDDPNHSLDALLSEAPAGWTLEDPAPDGERWETALYAGDRYIIDFIMMSPSVAARAVDGPRIYAWDYDVALGGPEAFHEGPEGSGLLKHYRVSDHRPVFVRLDD